MYNVYILKSILFGKYYVGVTSDLVDRLKRHNQGRSKWTRKYRPWQIIHTEIFTSKTEALLREKEIKSYKGGNKFKTLISAGIV